MIPILLALGISVTPAKIICKTVSVPAGDGCNTCSFQRCTDGSEQWDENMLACTLVLCAKDTRKNVKPHDPKEWEEKKVD